jgi:hypothetical protein
MQKKIVTPSRIDTKHFMRALAFSIDPQLLQDKDSPLQFSFVAAGATGKSTSAWWITGALGAQESAPRARLVNLFAKQVNTRQIDCIESNFYRNIYMIREGGMVFEINITDRNVEEFRKLSTDKARQEIRTLGGVDILEHATAEDCAEASLVIYMRNLMPQENCFEEINGQVSQLRAKFNLDYDPAKSNIYGVRILDVIVQDSRLLQSARFMNFFNTLPQMYSRGAERKKMFWSDMLWGL